MTEKTADTNISTNVDPDTAASDVKNAMGSKPDFSAAAAAAAEDSHICNTHINGADKSCLTLKKTSIGGQALIEGILMIGPQKRAIACRVAPDKIALETAENSQKKIFNIPFVRGVYKLFTQTGIGINALMRSAEIADSAGKGTQVKEEQKTEGKSIKPWQTTLIVLFSLLLSIGIFILLPSLIIDILKAQFQWQISHFWLAALEGVLRLTIFIFYLMFTSALKDMRRTWQYHGAEHKTVFCYEQRLPLTVENCRVQSRFHPRCGTSFLVLVILISIIAFALIGRYGIWLNILLRLLLIPVITGVSYELIRLAGKYDNLATRIISRPGLWIQRLTTKEPDDDMLEVAIAALTAVIPEEEGSDNWGE